MSNQLSFLSEILRRNNKRAKIAKNLFTKYRAAEYFLYRTEMYLTNYSLRSDGLLTHILKLMHILATLEYATKWQRPDKIAHKKIAFPEKRALMTVLEVKYEDLLRMAQSLSVSSIERELKASLFDEEELDHICNILDEYENLHETIIKELPKIEKYETVDQEYRK
jgi:hypothetical protein